MSDHKNHSVDKVTAAGLLVTLGIIYGDIGTSPLYVLKAIVGEGNKIDKDTVLGGISAIFWTLTFQTTLKYVWLTLRADNNGEGGIFSLFALVRRKIKNLTIFAMIGGAALLADGIITPPISVTSAVEGLTIVFPELGNKDEHVGKVQIHVDKKDLEKDADGTVKIQFDAKHLENDHNVAADEHHEKKPNYIIISIVITIITLLFMFQRFGTSIVGKAFGPIMFVWFAMLAILGVYQISQNFAVLEAINPRYAFNLIINKPEGFWLLGAIFLCTTGGEALYSDLGHCGRKNIRITWVYVKAALILNYMGQGAWLISHDGEILSSIPFYSVMPKDFVPFGIVIATSAAVIASQALITGSFTLISEAMRLNIWPKMKLVYPTLQKGQLYVPAINTLLWLGCVAIVLLFKESEKMEAAYGLSITITMLMTTILMANYLTTRRIKMVYVYLFLVTYITIEGAFLIANMRKFMDGGIVTIMIGGVLMFIMYVWYRSTQIKNKLTEYDNMNKYVKNLKELSSDLSVSKYATNLVFMTSSPSMDKIETKIIYSIFYRQPKRADIYWFVHVDTTDEPYTMEYKVDVLAEDDVVWVTFRLGFRIEQKINLYFRKVVEELVDKKEIDITSRYASLAKQKINGDFRFVVLEKYLSNENKLPLGEQIIMATYFFLKNYTINEKSWFGLDTSSVTVEKIPLVIQPMQEVNLKRVYQ